MIPACGVDGSDASREALEHARRLHEQVQGDRLTLSHVIAPPVHLGVYDPLQDLLAPGTPEWLTALAEARSGAEIALIDSVSAYLPVAAARWAHESAVDLLVVATHRAVSHRMTTGSFASYVAYHARCPGVMVPVHTPGE